jgi:hypothetical protein
MGVDFQKNYIFVDEAGFNTQMMRGRAWSRVGESAKSSFIAEKTLTSVLSAEYYLLEPSISSRLNFLNKAMLINWKKSFLNPSNKKKKKKKADKHGKDEFYIVMDYCKTHHTAFVIEAIKNRGYKP